MSASAEKNSDAGNGLQKLTCEEIIQILKDKYNAPILIYKIG